MATPDPVRSARSRLAYALRRDLIQADPSRVPDLRRQLTAAKLERAIREAIAAAPPLTPQQRTELAAILSGGAR